jgi:hypothetical protein
VVAATRSFTTVARAERDGLVVCAAVLLVVGGPPGRLGPGPVHDMTAWFYGVLDPRFELELEDLADAARGLACVPELDGVDLVVQGVGGDLRLEGCRIDLPMRTAGPASTLEYRLAHVPGGTRHLSLVA